MKNLKGRVAWLFGNNFDVDLIIGIENISQTDPEVLKKVCMKPYEEDFAEKVNEGDLIVAGQNFGYGHPHPQAMQSIRQLGIAGVLAESYAPAFFRSEMTRGYPLITCPGISDFVSRWDELVVDMERFQITNITRSASIQAAPLPLIVREIISLGGIVNYLKKELANPGAP
jgi:3-isopropylmalate/(R)-2-methylmalate dehydratase small subunit